ncbi:MAG: dTDP-4-dehydrorhamnose reductase, partial [Candidatus Gracilibacteria bacterium]
MKVLLLGKNGMLGSEFLRLLSNRDGVELTATDRDGFDITDEAALTDFVDKTAPEVVINCAAYTFVDNCEENKELAFKVNAEAPKNIAKLCKKHGAYLIHFSTDYVFDGGKKEYFENDETNPLSVYGQSKLEGEKNIAAECDKYYIFRISTLFGVHGGNFVQKIYEAAKSKDEIEVVDDYVSCPTYAADLAERIVNDFI